MSSKKGQLLENGEDRYSRQILIEDWDQKKVAESHIVIVGAGAIGSVVGVILGGMGVGKISMIDFDSVELSNLNRQLLFRDEDVGINKAEAAARELRRINPTIHVEAYPMKMQAVPKDVYETCDVIVGCLDTYLARRWLNSLAVQLKIPLVLGGMFAMLGNLQVVIPFETACFECQPLIPQEKLSQACTPLGAERKEDYEKQGIVKEEPPLPSVSTVSHVIGGLMAQEVTKLIVGFGKVVNNFLFYDLSYLAQTEMPLARSPLCPVCGEAYKAEKVEFYVECDESYEELKSRLSWAFGLADPTIIIGGIMLTSDETVQAAKIEAGKTLFVTDQRLARPIQVKITDKMEEEEDEEDEEKEEEGSLDA